MISVEQISQIVIDELKRCKDEAHWGDIVFKIDLKNGDPQQLAVGYEKTFRQPPAVPARAHAPAPA